MEQLTIRNNLDVDQVIIFRGAQAILPALAEETMDAERAQAFLNKCYPVVVKTHREPNGLPEQTASETVWLANMTGNLDLPEKIKVRVMDSETRRYKEIEAPNPKRDPKPQIREYDAGSWEAKDVIGQPFWYNYPKIPIKLAAFTRKPFTREIATWMLTRDGRMVDGRAGSLIQSRAPTHFEPDMKWSLNDARAYLRCIDPKAELGMDEEQLVKKAQQKKLTKEQTVALLRDTKDTLLKRLFFRLADPRFQLPTREEFQEFLTGRPAEEIEEAELTDLLKRVEGELAPKKQAEAQV